MRPWIFPHPLLRLLRLLAGPLLIIASTVPAAAQGLLANGDLEQAGPSAGGAPGIPGWFFHVWEGDSSLDHTAVAALQKRLEAPSVDKDDKKKVLIPEYTKKDLENQVIWVSAKMEGGNPVIRIEKEVVAPARLLRDLKRVASRSRKAEMLLEHERAVPHEVVVQILDAARGARLNRVRVLVP